jgi:hypothetical protein
MKNFDYSNTIHEKYIDAFDKISNLNVLIQRRFNKLKNESELVKGIKNCSVPFRDPSTLINFKNIAKSQSYMLNPNIYCQQFVDPIYYPLEMPVNAEPICLPKIELGLPVLDNKGKNCGGGLRISDALLLMSNINNSNKNSKFKKNQNLLNSLPMIVKNFRQKSKHN